jgi:hypothetical protein
MLRQKITIGFSNESNDQEVAPLSTLKKDYLDGSIFAALRETSPLEKHDPFYDIISQGIS